MGECPSLIRPGDKMARERHNRIVQMIPTSCPLWAVIAVDGGPSPEGHHFVCVRVHGLALTEDWQDPGAFDGPEPAEDRHREIHPIYYEDGYFDAPDRYGDLQDPAVDIIEQLPITQQEVDELNRLALQQLDQRKKLRAAQIAKMKAAEQKKTAS